MRISDWSSDVCSSDLRLQVGWAHLDWAIKRHLGGELTATEGAAAKLWHTELQWDVMDKCLQLHGGAGYMNEYPIARALRGARVSRNYGGTNENMKALNGRRDRKRRVEGQVESSTGELGG